MITCEESQKSFSPYLDGALTHAAGDALRQHLEACPVCRGRLDETRSVVRGLSLLSRPAPPATLSASIKDALIIERAARVASPPLTIPERCVRWLQTRLMPYTVGAAYSLILFVAVFGALRQQLRILSNLAAASALENAQADTVAATPNAPGIYDVTRPLSPGLAVAARAPFTDESPTLNPQGALAALTLAPPSIGRPGDDDMIVVADVYGNGSASLAEVVKPPRNRRMIEDLQDAFREGPAFVPASLDRRPQTMRVVFVLQKMNVADRAY